jgi:uncharacterized protein (DUF2225 family)
MSDERPKRVTFFSKESLSCPVCDASFYKEELLSGSGRLIAGDLTDELRRLFEPSKKYGAIYPLIYYCVVCPVCMYSAFPKDFTEQKSEPDTIDKLRIEKTKRTNEINLLFKKNLDFTAPRGLEEGATSYLLSMMCYEHSKRSYAPTIKQGISSLRAAWLFGDLHAQDPNQNYDYLSRLLYRKSRFFFHQAIEKEQTGAESMGSVSHLGPDLDKNYGYDGVLYLTGYLEYRYGPKKDPEVRAKLLDRARKIISRVHGMGRASKAKPSALLDKAKDIHRAMGEEINVLRGDEEPQ